MKKKHKSQPLCVCTQNRTLSTQAPAVQILEFLEAFTENFMAQYGRKIHRHYAKRNINVHEPWKGDCTGELF